MDRQNPTCTNVFIRSVSDVHRIFYGVLLEKLPMIHRRLDAQEREALTSGCCYVWEDRGPHAITGLGIERFTEGRHWSASRVRDDFLFYYEKWKSLSADDSNSQPPPRNWDPFVKQTYSVYVNPHPGKPETTRRKWHLTAYFTQATVDRLGSVDDIEELHGLVVPEGMFRSSRTIKPRTRAGSSSSSKAGSSSTSTSNKAGPSTSRRNASTVASSSPTSGRKSGPRTYAPIAPPPVPTSQAQQSQAQPRHPQGTVKVPNMDFVQYEHPRPPSASSSTHPPPMSHSQVQSQHLHIHTDLAQPQTPHFAATPPERYPSAHTDTYPAYATTAQPIDFSLTDTYAPSFSPTSTPSEHAPMSPPTPHPSQNNGMSAHLQPNGNPHALSHPPDHQSMNTDVYAYSPQSSYAYSFTTAGAEFASSSSPTDPHPHAEMFPPQQTHDGTAGFAYAHPSAEFGFGASGPSPNCQFPSSPEHHQQHHHQFDPSSAVAAFQAVSPPYQASTASFMGAASFRSASAASYQSSSFHPPSDDACTAPSPFEPQYHLYGGSPAPSSASGSSGSSRGSGSGRSVVGGREEALLPLQQLRRYNPYRRDPEDSRALQVLGTNLKRV